MSGIFQKQLLQMPKDVVTTVSYQLSYANKAPFQTALFIKAIIWRDMI